MDVITRVNVPMLARDCTRADLSKDALRTLSLINMLVMICKHSKMTQSVLDTLEYICKNYSTNILE